MLCSALGARLYERRRSDRRFGLIRLALVFVLALILGAASAETAPKVAPQPMSVADFRRELVGMPLCGTASTGELAGKVLKVLESRVGEGPEAPPGTPTRSFRGIS